VIFNCTCLNEVIIKVDINDDRANRIDDINQIEGRVVAQYLGCFRAEFGIMERLSPSETSHKTGYRITGLPGNTGTQLGIEIGCFQMKINTLVLPSSHSLSFEDCFDNLIFSI